MAKKTINTSLDDVEIFTAKGAKIKDPKVIILPNHHFLFNAAFVHKAEIHKSTHVVLGYSEQSNSIVFQFTSDTKAKGALTLINKNNSSSVGTRSFFNYYFLNVQDISGRYKPENVQIAKIGKVWVINLNNKLPE